MIILDKDKEIRTIQAQVETRQDENDSNVIEGYALKFNSRSQVLGYGTTFVEILDRHCLDNADMRSTVATFNHNQSQIIGRVNANLSLNIDDVGLRFTVTLPDTTIAHDVLENIRAGILNKCSFAFTVSEDDDADDWQKTDEDGIDYIRTIRKIDHLYDVSVVTTPAYLNTNVGVRSLERVKQIKEEPLKIAREKKRNYIAQKLKIIEAISK